MSTRMRTRARIRSTAVTLVASLAVVGCTAGADACEGAEQVRDAYASDTAPDDRDAQVERYEQLADGYDQIADDLGYERIGDQAEAARRIAESYAAGAADPLLDATLQDEDDGGAIARLMVAEHPSGLPTDIAEDLTDRCGTDWSQLPSQTTTTDGAVDDGAVDDGEVGVTVDGGEVDDGEVATDG